MTCCFAGCSTRELRATRLFGRSGDPALRLDREKQVATPDELGEQSVLVTHSVDKDIEATEGAQVSDLSRSSGTENSRRKESGRE